jgi:hypothetical protein
MADTYDMATLAFGAPSRRFGTLRRAAGKLGRGVGARHPGAAPRKHHRRRKTRAAPVRHPRGIRLSNEFVKTFLLMELAKAARS